MGKRADAMGTSQTLHMQAAAQQVVVCFVKAVCRVRTCNCSALQQYCAECHAELCCAMVCCAVMSADPGDA